jgi:hypothetical protein
MMMNNTLTFLNKQLPDRPLDEFTVGREVTNFLGARACADYAVVPGQNEAADVLWSGDPAHGERHSAKRRRSQASDDTRVSKVFRVDSSVCVQTPDGQLEVRRTVILRDTVRDKRVKIVLKVDSQCFAPQTLISAADMVVILPITPTTERGRQVQLARQRYLSRQGCLARAA